METMLLSSSPFPDHKAASTYEELSMQQRLLFLDSLKDLKNLKLQLYSAAEYFEVSYQKEDHKKRVMNTLKEYATKALINTVDHLGSVSFKVNGLLDNKIDKISETELRVSCIEQRVRTCQELVHREGLLQQFLVIKAPEYHKHYILPGGTMIECGKQAIPTSYELCPSKEEIFESQRKAVLHSTIRGGLPSFRKLHSTSFQRGRSASPSSLTGKIFSPDKRDVSPLPTSNSLSRLGSLSSSSKPTALSSSSIGRRYTLEPKKSASMRQHAEKNEPEKIDRGTAKRTSILKALLSRRRSRKDEIFSSYFDEY